MLATTVAPVSASGGSSSANQAAIPGVCNPTLLSRPASTGSNRGGGLPAQGSTDTDLTTTAPREARSRKGASSAPWPDVPEAEKLSLLPFSVDDLAGFHVAEVLPGRALMLVDPVYNAEYTGRAGTLLSLASAQQAKALAPEPARPDLSARCP